LCWWRRVRWPGWGSGTRRSRSYFAGSVGVLPKLAAGLGTTRVSSTALGCAERMRTALNEVALTSVFGVVLVKALGWTAFTPKRSLVRSQYRLHLYLQLDDPLPESLVTGHSFVALYCERKIDRAVLFRAFGGGGRAYGRRSKQIEDLGSPGVLCRWCAATRSGCAIRCRSEGSIRVSSQ